MSLHINSDALYLSAPKERIKVGGHFYLENIPNSSNPNRHNGAILSISGIKKKLMSSAVEGEFGGLFSNTYEGEVIHTTMEELVHKQLSTPSITDKSTRGDISNDTIKQQRSNVMDM